MNPHPDRAIEIDQLSRIYESSIGLWRRKRTQTIALQDVTFQIGAGQLFGLVGPNGAGKTTLVRILSTLLLPTQGTVRMLGWDVRQDEKLIRRNINFVFGGERGLYNRLSARDNIRYFASLYNLPPEVEDDRISKLLELVGLIDRQHDRVETFSRGMKQRLHIAKALINQPKILLLDEPTTGLDPIAAHEVRSLIKNVQHSGTTILLTSHNMFEVESLSDCIAVINHGKIITLGSPEQVKSQVDNLTVVEFRGLLSQREAIEQVLGSLTGIGLFTSSALGPHLVYSIQTAQSAIILDILRQHLPSLQEEELRVRKPTLEDAYIRLIKGDDRDAKAL